jgi:hypothetical protein
MKMVTLESKGAAQEMAACAAREVSAMEKIKPELLSFLKPSPLPLRVLVIESTAYLPQLRRDFPRASLTAVVQEKETAERPELSALGVHWIFVDYLSVPLPVETSWFDYILGDLLLEQAGNPQDIAAGLSQFLKPTGALLTSFRNIRHWSVLSSLMDGHYYSICARLFAKPEFQKLLYASYYKEVRMRAQRRPVPEGSDLLHRLEAAGFANLHDDLETEYWLVYAARSMPELALLKSMYTEEVRKTLSRLLKRIEYGIEPQASAAAFWRLYEQEGLFPAYTANFVQEAVFHHERFWQQLREETPAAYRQALAEMRREAQQYGGEEA